MPEEGGFESNFMRADTIFNPEEIVEVRCWLDLFNGKVTLVLDGDNIIYINNPFKP